MTSYTDFTTSVCNLIFESAGPDVVDLNIEPTKRLYLSEKTLKGLLFSKENIFSMWCGNEYFIPVLQDYGFWFLNFEFYNHTEPKAVVSSLIKTTEYLKQLKNQLKTNESVHKYLLDTFGSKLENNGKMLDQFLLDCEVKDNIIKLLKYE